MKKRIINRFLTTLIYIKFFTALEKLFQPKDTIGFMNEHEDIRVHIKDSSLEIYIDILDFVIKIVFEADFLYLGSRNFQVNIKMVKIKTNQESLISCHPIIQDTQSFSSKNTFKTFSLAEAKSSNSQNSYLYSYDATFNFCQINSHFLKSISLPTHQIKKINSFLSRRYFFLHTTDEGLQITTCENNFSPKDRLELLEFYSEHRHEHLKNKSQKATAVFRFGKEIVIVYGSLRRNKFYVNFYEVFNIHLLFPKEDVQEMHTVLEGIKYGKFAKAKPGLFHKKFFLEGVEKLEIGDSHVGHLMELHVRNFILRQTENFFTDSGLYIFKVLRLFGEARKAQCQIGGVSLRNKRFFNFIQSHTYFILEKENVHSKRNHIYKQTEKTVNNVVISGGKAKYFAKWSQGVSVYFKTPLKNRFYFYFGPFKYVLTRDNNMIRIKLKYSKTIDIILLLKMDPYGNILRKCFLVRDIADRAKHLKSHSKNLHELIDNKSSTLEAFLFLNKRFSFIANKTEDKFKNLLDNDVFFVDKGLSRKISKRSKSRRFVYIIKNYSDSEICRGVNLLEELEEFRILGITGWNALKFKENEKSSSLLEIWTKDSKKILFKLFQCLK